MAKKSCDDDMMMMMMMMMNDDDDDDDDDDDNDEMMVMVFTTIIRYFFFQANSVTKATKETNFYRNFVSEGYIGFSKPNLDCLHQILLTLRHC